MWALWKISSLRHQAAWRIPPKNRSPITTSDMIRLRNSVAAHNALLAGPFRLIYLGTIPGERRETDTNLEPCSRGDIGRINTQDRKDTRFFIWSARLYRNDNQPTGAQPATR